MIVAFRVLGAEVFAVEFLKASPDEEHPKLEGGPGGTGQFEYGFFHAESDVILNDQDGGKRKCL